MLAFIVTLRGASSGRVPGTVYETRESGRRLFGYAPTLAGEEDFFIRKAIGWALRDYARHDPDAVRGFLLRSGGRLSALDMREAAKHLGDIDLTQRQARAVDCV